MTQLLGMNKMEIILTVRVLTRTPSLDSETLGAVAHSKEPTDRCQGPHQLRDCKVP